MNILITGSGGYISGALTRHLQTLHTARAISVRGDGWRDDRLGGCDALVHTAAIVHDTRADTDLSRAVNTDLTLALARKAKAEGVGQFIFLSTMAVYGDGTSVITENTPCVPDTPYGSTKLEAEKLLRELADDSFRVCILRPPMVYGPDCPGNYRRLRALALRLPLVPSCDNRRSMLYVGHLCSFIQVLAEARADGLYFPQDADYMSTGRVMSWIREAHGLRTVPFSPMDFAIRLGARFAPPLRKAFGSLYYDEALTRRLPQGFELLSNREAILRTEREWSKP